MLKGALRIDDLPAAAAVQQVGLPLLTQFVQSPILIDPDRVNLVRDYIHVVASHPHINDMLAAAGNDDNFWPTDSNDWRASLRPYNVKDGILQIPVLGVLLNRFSFQVGRWATGYTYIQRAFERGMADANVRGIAFVHDSPGGEVAGNFELNDLIHAARGQKPMRAFAADHSYSASYSLATAADSIVVSRSGGVGSIGVVTAHVEYSGMLKNSGIVVTFIFAGKHKVDGNPYEKLSADAKARIQTKIDKIYGVFTAAVARNRGMDEKAIRGTEALTYDAQDAIKVGLADKVGALEDEMTVFSADIDTGDENMADNATDKGIPQAQHDQAVVAARSEGEAAGMTAQKTRINAILALDVSKKRGTAALAAALETDMTVEQATAFLGKLPEEKAEEPKAKTRNHFEEAMGKGDKPAVTAGDDGDDDIQASDPAAAAKTILGNYQRDGGKVRKSA